MAGRALDKLAAQVCELDSAWRGNRTSHEALWQSAERYLIPTENSFTEEVSPGVERNRNIVDTTGPRALELFASFLHTLLNNPSLRWMKVSLPDLSKAERESVAVKQWIEETEVILHAEAGSESMNLYSHLHTIWLHMGAYGTSCLFVEERGEQLRSRAYHLADVAVQENEAGFIDTVTRQFKYTPRQALDRWGEDVVDPDFAKLAKTAKGAQRSRRFIHAVLPKNDPAIAGFLPARVKNNNSPFASLWIDTEAKKMMHVGVYEEFPYMVPRWLKVRNDPYGRGPGTKVLPDVRMVNRMFETILRGAEKLVDPPLLIPDGGLISPLRLFPGGISFSEGNVKPEALIPPGASRIEMGNELLFRKQRDVERGFFVQLFQTEDTPVKTATQVLQEVDERNRAVSPMLVRQQAELFHPLVKRIFGILARLGRIPPLPDVVQETRVSVEYLSPLTGSQVQIEALGLVRLMETAAGWAQVDEAIFDIFDGDEVAKVLHAGSGAPMRVLRTENKVKAVREARDQAQQQQAQQENALQEGEVQAKLIAATNKGGGNRS